MEKPIRRLGIMGGTFDPIHYGHLVTAEGARCEFQLDQVLFLPSGIPPHKQSSKVSGVEHRFMMTVLATLSNPHFDVSRIDIDRDGISYTVDTLRILRERFGTETELFFITGADATLEIVGWKDPERILSLSHFIAATRPGFSLDTLPSEAQKFINTHQDRFHVLQVPALAISSTDVRSRVHSGHSIRYLVPEQVEYYIKRNKMYK